MRSTEKPAFYAQGLKDVCQFEESERETFLAERDEFWKFGHCSENWGIYLAHFVLGMHSHGKTKCNYRALSYCARNIFTKKPYCYTWESYFARWIELLSLLFKSYLIRPSQEEWNMYNIVPYFKRGTSWHELSQLVIKPLDKLLFLNRSMLLKGVHQPLARYYFEPTNDTKRKEKDRFDPDFQCPIWMQTPVFPSEHFGTGLFGVICMDRQARCWDRSHFDKAVAR